MNAKSKLIYLTSGFLLIVMFILYIKNEETTEAVSKSMANEKIENIQKENKIPKKNIIKKVEKKQENQQNEMTLAEIDELIAQNEKERLIKEGSDIEGKSNKELIKMAMERADKKIFKKINIKAVYNDMLKNAKQLEVKN